MHYSFDFFTIKPYCTFQSGLLDWSQNYTWQKKSCCNEKFFKIYQFGWVIFIIVFWFLLSSLNGHIVYFCSCKWFNCPWLCIKSSIAITIGTKSDDFTDCSIFLISAAIIEPTWDLVIYSMMPQGHHADPDSKWLALSESTEEELLENEILFANTQGNHISGVKTARQWFKDNGILGVPNTKALVSPTPASVRMFPNWLFMSLMIIAQIPMICVYIL